MINFPAVCIDNFFDNPDKVREWGLSLSKQKDPEGRWPGKRSEHLCEVDEKWNQMLVAKILLAYYGWESMNHVTWNESYISFQVVKSHEHENCNKGLIHMDADSKDEIGIAGLIYLTPNADLNSGTSIYKLKDNHNFKKEDGEHISKLKKDLYLNNNVDTKEWDKAIEKNYNDFDETIRFNNVYNRMICYNTFSWHGAMSTNARDDDRLTLVFFIKGIHAGMYPLSRVSSMPC